MRLAAIIGIAFAGWAGADDSRPGESPVPGIQQCAQDAPWLGLTVGRLDDAVRAHAPALPRGIGFVVAAVAEGGPAEKAGVKPYDVFWKLGDQWLANEAQLLTLLCLRSAGDEVELGIYRSGEALAVPVVLASQPEKQGIGVVPVKPGNRQDAPMKVLNPAERSARIEMSDGKAVLSIVNDEPEVKIVSSGGSVIYEGPVRDRDGISLVPDEWKPRVGALQRALAHAMQGGRVPTRARVLSAADGP